MNTWLLKRSPPRTLCWATVKLYNAYCIVTPVLAAECWPLLQQHSVYRTCFSPDCCCFFVCFLSWNSYGFWYFILKEGKQYYFLLLYKYWMCFASKKYGPLSSLSCHHGGTWKTSSRFMFPSHSAVSLFIKVNNSTAPVLTSPYLKANPSPVFWWKETCWVWFGRKDETELFSTCF